jgi:glycogen debranching enzyme
MRLSTFGFIDTFISLRGILLLTSRLDEAKWIILSYASALRHGLIPNLLGEGTGPRYNCRDAVWWWLQSIKDYCLKVGSNYILQEQVYRLYPSDDSQVSESEEEITCDCLHEVINEVVERHWNGISFTERNAGPAIDSNMPEAGFFVEISVDKTTGFVGGGSIYNCGTWMDKMGRNRMPVTPRDGAAVEIVGLSFSVIQWLASLLKVYPHQRIGNNDWVITLREWSSLIRANFEKEFWVDIRENLGCRRCFYKDTFGSNHPRGDLQLRPNFPIAMVVAPDLFDFDHARLALAITRDILMGPVGIKTLDPDDQDYNGFYANGSDNYHQGPEWLFPVGFFLRALIAFSKKEDLEDNLNYVKRVISNHHVVIENSEWLGLPELTNAEGAACPESCAVQAWSHSTMLELMYDIQDLEIE